MTWLAAVVIDAVAGLRLPQSPVSACATWPSTPYLLVIPPDWQIIVRSLRDLAWHPTGRAQPTPATATVLDALAQAGKATTVAT